MIFAFLDLREPQEKVSEIGFSSDVFNIQVCQRAEKVMMVKNKRESSLQVQPQGLV